MNLLRDKPLMIGGSGKSRKKNLPPSPPGGKKNSITRLARKKIQHGFSARGPSAQIINGPSLRGQKSFPHALSRELVPIKGGLKNKKLFASFELHQQG